MIALKIDVDTHDGMRVGVPRLLDCLARHRAKATFFLSLGPDRSGLAILQMRKPAFARKMFSTGAPSLYGWRTILSGTLLPARPIASAFPELVWRIEGDGHEAAVHAWDHRSWQDDLPRFKPARIRAHYQRAVDMFERLTGHLPVGCGAPAWMTTPTSLAIQDEFPFTYASDLRASPACRLYAAGGVRRLPQFPGTGPCLEELLGNGSDDAEALASRLLEHLAAAPGAPTVLTLHAEVEGGPYLDVLECLLPRLDRFGELVTMAQAAARLSAQLPLRRWCRVDLPGRAYPVSSSRPFASTPAAGAGR